MKIFAIWTQIKSRCSAVVVAYRHWKFERFIKRLARDQDRRHENYDQCFSKSSTVAARPHFLGRKQR